ncbi:beta strand repeat-containing protein, partial [Helicobacter pullorum]|uniref:beta strand repeat-containing protein n=1 Tax=Helicobacter pullorum TaxID=35818 RepID=UPI0013150554
NQSLETKEILKSKIQDSKIQLESNSPKLKDSDSKLESKNPDKIQSPKASKNLVNPQSPKVLESNLKLDSKNTRESKKIQRVKNTYDSTNSQKSKESSKVKSLIRTIPVSIALASALTSNAVAAWQFGSLQSSGSGLPSSTGTISGEDLIVDGLTIDLRNYWIGINNYLYGVAQNGTGGNLTINNNSKIEVYKMSGELIKVQGSATVGIITNNGIINRDDTGTSSSRAALNMGNNSYAKAFINNGIIYWEESAAVVSLWGNSSIGIIKNTGTIQSEGAAIATREEPNVTIGSIELDGGLIQRITNAGTATNNAVATTGDVINLANNANVGKIIVSNSASIHGNISLSNTTIDDKISFSDSNMTGNISLGGSQVANGISIDGSNISGNISIAAGSGVNSTIANGVTLTNNSTIGDFTLDNGSSILNGLTLSNDSTITNLNVTKRGNIDELLLSQGTINGNLKVEGNADGAGTNTATIGEITLANNSTIAGNISVKGDGASANANAKIGNIILEDGTGIGGSIAVGDSNGAANTNGEIAGITLYGNSTIAGGIINNTNGNIGTIVSNTGTNINNTITNHGTIGSLKVNNQGTIVYRSDSGIITDALSVASGATLDIKDSTGSNTGTIELKSDSATLEDGSTLNLANGSTLVGH